MVLQKHVTILTYLVQLKTYDWFGFTTTWASQTQSNSTFRHVLWSVNIKYQSNIFKKGPLDYHFIHVEDSYGSSKSRIWYGSLFHAWEKCYEWPGRASVNLVETLCVMEICMGVKKCYESHGCVPVHQNIWMTVNPTAVPPSWLEDMADWRSSQSANKNWVTHTDG